MKRIRRAPVIVILFLFASCGEKEVPSHDDGDFLSDVVRNARYDLELLAKENTRALSWRFPENSEIDVMEIEAFIAEGKELQLWPLNVRALPASRERGNLLAAIKARELGNEPPFLIKAEVAGEGGPRLVDLMYRKHDHRLLAIIVSEIDG